MKKLLALVLALTMICSLASCGGDSDSAESVSTVVDITMPYVDDYYETEDWALDELMKKFESLGYTDIKTERLGESSRYEYGIIKNVKIDGGRLGWDAGEVFRSDSEVVISYYDPTPTLTAENCPELAEILNGETQYWDYFAEMHDGEFIEFDGCVVERLDSNLLNDPIIYVCGGDYKDSGNKQKIHLTYISITPEIENHRFYGTIGNDYRIIGKIDFDDSEYYNMLTIETILFEDRL